MVRRSSRRPKINGIVTATAAGNDGLWAESGDTQQASSRPCTLTEPQRLFCNARSCQLRSSENICFVRGCRELRRDVPRKRSKKIANNTELLGYI